MPMERLRYAMERHDRPRRRPRRNHGTPSVQMRRRYQERTCRGLCNPRSMRKRGNFCKRDEKRQFLQLFFLEKLFLPFFLSFFLSSFLPFFLSFFLSYFLTYLLKSRVMCACVRARVCAREIIKEFRTIKAQDDGDGAKRRWRWRSMTLKDEKSPSAAFRNPTRAVRLSHCRSIEATAKRARGFSHGQEAQ